MTMASRRGRMPTVLKIDRTRFFVPLVFPDRSSGAVLIVSVPISTDDPHPNRHPKGTRPCAQGEGHLSLLAHHSWRGVRGRGQNSCCVDLRVEEVGQDGFLSECCTA